MAIVGISGQTVRLYTKWKGEFEGVGKKGGGNFQASSNGEASWNGWKKVSSVICREIAAARMKGDGKESIPTSSVVR